VGIRFPTNASRQKRCPVCKAAGPGTNPPVTPRPETAGLLIAIMHRSAKRQAGPVVLCADLLLGWDSGVCKHSHSRTSLGAVVRVAKLEAPEAGEGLLQIQFCSIACLRQFLLAAVDELAERAEAVGPRIATARGKGESTAGSSDVPARKKRHR
jgi:hypothetical protein